MFGDIVLEFNFLQQCMQRLCFAQYIWLHPPFKGSAPIRIYNIRGTYRVSQKT